MFTRFQTEKECHVLDAPIIRIPPDVPGAGFVSAIGGAFEYEETHLRSRLLTLANELKSTLQTQEFKTQAKTSKFLNELNATIEFLETNQANSIRLYSYDRRPSIEVILDAFAEGSGSQDWAIEELLHKGDKGCKSLLSILNKEKDKERLLSSISMLLIVSPSEETNDRIRTFLESCEEDIGKDAALILSAYTKK